MLVGLSQNSLVSQFLMLSYFSRLCILCLASATIWSVVAFVRLVIGVRRSSKSNSNNAALPRLLLRQQFDGIFYLSELASVACIADLLFSFIHTYLARGTDANPFPVLILAWGVSQMIFLALLLIHSLRWYVSTVLFQKHGSL